VHRRTPRPKKFLEVGVIEQLLDLAAQPVQAEIPAALPSTDPGNEFLLSLSG
jgi:hypothetical protein